MGDWEDDLRRLRKSLPRRSKIANAGPSTPFDAKNASNSAQDDVALFEELWRVPSSAGLLFFGFCDGPAGDGLLGEHVSGGDRADT